MASPEKDVPPCHHMLWLGIWINNLNMTLSFPSFRISELHKELHKWLKTSSFTRHELQQLLGKMSFVSACVRPGPVVITIKLWSRKLEALKVELLLDHSTCVSGINSQYSSNLFMQQCLRELWLLLALFNIQLVVRHVCGCHNWLADSFSRFHTGDLVLSSMHYPPDCSSQSALYQTVCSISLLWNIFLLLSFYFWWCFLCRKLRDFTGICLPDSVAGISRVYEQEHENSLKRLYFNLWTLSLGSVSGLELVILSLLSFSFTFTILLPFPY